MSLELAQNDMLDYSAGVIHLKTSLFHAGLIGLIKIMFYAATIGFKIFGLCTVVASAAMSGSFVKGILFGMPKRKEIENDGYSLNKSFVEISKWPTKINMGQSLVSLVKVPARLSRYVEWIYDPLRLPDLKTETKCIFDLVKCFNMIHIFWYLIFAFRIHGRAKLPKGILVMGGLNFDIPGLSNK